jgi:NAD-dependent dihydropyrimidine dehydrogenase PreA subunit
MCQFCHQHGEGKKWYLNAENYTRELLSDLARRRYIIDFVGEVGSLEITELRSSFDRAMKAPAWLRDMVYWSKQRRYRRDHFGQVVPMEDLERALDLTHSIVRLPCICRKSSTGRVDARYCFGLNLDMERMTDIRDALFETFRSGPYNEAFEVLSKQEALDLLREYEKNGLIHTLWTFKTPFIGGLCNCDRADCLAMVCYNYQFQLFFRSEYVAFVDQAKCTGCKACFEACQFGALGYSDLGRRTFIDPVRCYGCGICRSRCEQGAIRLSARSSHPIARHFW